jgi:hypothetical protein
MRIFTQIFVTLFFIFCVVVAIVSLTLLCIFEKNNGIQNYSCNQTSKGVDLSLLILKEGFSIKIFQKNIRNPRQLAISSKYLYVGSSMDEVIAIPLNSTFRINETTHYSIIKNISTPAGVFYHQNDLFIGTETQILRYSQNKIN